MSRCFWPRIATAGGPSRWRSCSNKIVNEPAPAGAKVIDPLTKVTKENVDSYAKNWEKWLGKNRAHPWRGLKEVAANGFASPKPDVRGIHPV